MKEIMFLYLIKNKLTIKTHSSLSSKNICYYLKFRKPMCPRQFSRIISQNPEYVKRFCDDSNISFHFSIRKWISEYSS